MDRLYKALFNMPTFGVVITSSDGVAVEVNDKFCEIVGRKKNSIIKTDILSHDQGLTHLRNVLNSGFNNVEDLEVDIITSNSEKRILKITASSIENNGETFFVIIANDKTEAKIMEKHWLQAQKMESIATLAGGVAHDVNNVLMAIQGYISLLLSRMAAEDDRRPLLRNAESSIIRGSELTHSLIGFVENMSVEMRDADIVRVVKRAVELYSRSHKDVDISYNYNQPELEAKISEQQIKQCVVNILDNAVKASDNAIIVSVTKKRLKRTITYPYNLAPGDYIQIAITDTGRGIEPESLPRVFDPFFTTKNMGHGSGLGLAAVYSIVKNHKGIVDVESIPGKGAVFKIFLPLVHEDKERISMEKQHQCNVRKTILLVDDEDIVLDVTKMMLDSLGYKVVVASGGEEGVREFKRAGGFDLVILDWVMPVVSGRQVLNTIKQLEPEQKVLVSTGFGSAKIGEKISSCANVWLVNKPFPIELLDKKIEEAISA